MRIAFIGGGNMAVALIKGLISRGVMPGDILAIHPGEESRRRNSRQLGILTQPVVDGAIRDFDAIVLAVKPQIAREVAGQVSRHLNASQLFITIAAGIRLIELSKWLGGHGRIVRAMPNTPALIGMGISAMVSHPDVDSEGRTLASEVMGAAGKILWLDDEKHIDAVTAVSGSGPAYVFYFIEAMQMAAKQLGLEDEDCSKLVTATFVGASNVALQSNDTLNTLRQNVTSKGGTTEAALAVFDKLNVKAAIVRGILAAAERAKEIGDEFGFQ
jgi:pyrroline-5-carboxylate reductase